MAEGRHQMRRNLISSMSETGPAGVVLPVFLLPSSSILHRARPQLHSSTIAAAVLVSLESLVRLIRASRHSLLPFALSCCIAGPERNRIGIFLSRVVYLVPSWRLSSQLRREFTLPWSRTSACIVSGSPSVRSRRRRAPGMSFLSPWRLRQNSCRCCSRIRSGCLRSR